MGQEKNPYLFLYFATPSLPTSPHIQFGSFPVSPNRAGAVGQRQRPTHVPVRTAPEIAHENEIKCVLLRIGKRSFYIHTKTHTYIYVHTPQEREKSEFCVMLALVRGFSPHQTANKKGKQPPAHLALNADPSKRHKYGVSAAPPLPPPKWGYRGEPNSIRSHRLLSPIHLFP